ncbi:MAG: pyrroline-5-carboxylate reductase [Bacteroidetes bacterium]|nr:pyrroline-5-carboxylate reductase [Bacteroidota bacterium]
MNLNKRIAIIGCGNIGSAIAEGIIKEKKIENENLMLTRRNTSSLEKYREHGVNIISDNVEAVAKAHIIILCVTPQQLDGVLEEMKLTLEPGRHIIQSVVSGASINQIREKLGVDVPIIRVMPNLALSIQQSMTCLSGEERDREAMDYTKELFDCMGKTVEIHEELMVPATALCACGVAFFLRAIRAASQGGIEIGFHAEEALLMAAQTALGAAQLLLEDKAHPEREVDKVTTPRGCTIVGLNQMEHNGFSSSMIKGIVTSAEKAETLYSQNE